MTITNHLPLFLFVPRIPSCLFPFSALGAEDKTSSSPFFLGSEDLPLADDFSHSIPPFHYQPNDNPLADLL